MEIQIKKAVKAGNSSAVTLPRAWLNQEVRVELLRKTPEIILLETLALLKKYIKLEEVIGIYLVGSYARQEEDTNSDIDLLVLTSNTDKELVHEGIYSVLIISKELLEQKLKSDLFPIGQMIKEAQPLLNSDYLSRLSICVTKKNVKWYLETTKEKLELVEQALNISKNSKKSPPNRLVYTLILRIRTIEIIKKLMDNKNYSKREFIKLINNISGEKNAYNSYLAVKNNLNEENKTTSEEIRKLYEYLSKQLIFVIKKIEQL